MSEWSIEHAWKACTYYVHTNAWLLSALYVVEGLK